MDKKRFFKIVFSIGLPVYIFFCLVGVYQFLPIFKFLYEGDETTYVRMATIDAIVSIVIIINFIGICWLFSSFLPDMIMKPLSYISKNINKFFCVSWVVIFNTKLFRDFIVQNISLLVSGTIVTLLTAGIVIFYQKFLETKFVKFFPKHKLFWILSVWIFSVIVTCFAFSAFDKYPNFINNYLGY